MSDDDARRELRALQILEAALEKPTGERLAFVDGEAASDEALRDEVLRLLEFAGEDDELAPFVAPSAPSPEAERTIGPYRLKARVGAGGMGEVWRAERADGAFHREVAVKLLRADVGGDELLERFARERQVQAALQHPGIAQLLDGGEDERGVPYLVLEYVDGRPIVEHCRRAKLDDRARLARFRDVGAAVAHAHARGVVHRDLKPSNILVGEDGRPRLLDFGIARVLDPAMIAPGLDVTQGTFRMMTPAYASPEQLRLEPATPASDQYALGVLLYELLTEHLPFDLEGRSPAEIERLVTDEEPSRPSETRRDRRLAGDLDWIVLRALRKEARRRYASVDDLAQDIRRFLTGVPVRARPDSTAYRVSKFVRRYPVPVALVALLFVVLSAGILVSLDQRDRAREAADAASLARADADRKREEAETVTSFLTSMIADAAPGGRVDREATIRDALDVAAADLERGDWTGREALEARLRLEVGRAYYLLGAYAPARPHLERAMALVAAMPPPRDDLWAATVYVQASLLKAEERYAEAEVLARELLAYRETQGDERARLAALNDVAGMARSQERLDEARSLFEAAIEGFEAIEDGEAADGLAQALNNLGVLESQSGRPAEAIPLLERALAIGEARAGPNAPVVLLYRSNLGRVLGEVGEVDRSIPMLREVLDERCRLLGMDHADTCQTRTTLTLQLVRTGQAREAAELAEWNVRMLRDAHGSRHVLTANALEIAGKLAYNAFRDLDAAWLRTAEALEIRTALFPRHDRAIVDLQLGLGLLMRQRGDHATAIELLQGALGAPEEELVASGLIDPITLMLTRSCVDSGRLADAAWAFERRAAGLERLRGPDDPRTIQAIQEAGVAALKLGRLDVARERLETAYARWSALDAPPDHHLRRCIEGSIQLARRRGDDVAAAQWTAARDDLDRRAAEAADGSE
ncbi:MAG: tetratricopeptide repeat protein [Planctomycetota bacterium JB042]